MNTDITANTGKYRFNTGLVIQINTAIIQINTALIQNTEIIQVTSPNLNTGKYSCCARALPDRDALNIAGTSFTINPTFPGR